MGRRGSYKKSETSRKQVIEAAVVALAERGYARTSVSDIASAAGMSKGAVHYHFESKDDLIAQVLERCAAVMRDRVRDAWDAPGEPMEKIRRALRAMRAMRKQGEPELRVLADLMAQGIHDPKLQQPLAVMFKANREEVFEQVVQSLTKFGLKPKVPAHVIPRLLLGALDGLALHDFFDPAAPEDDETIEDALETIAVMMFES